MNTERIVAVMIRQLQRWRAARRSKHAATEATSQALRERLSQVIAWVGPRASATDLRGSTRSRELNSGDLSLDWMTYPKSDFSVDEYRRQLTRQAQAVETVAQRRAALLKNEPPSGIDVDAAEGRLLVFKPNSTCYDGMAETESHGFFDTANCPGWDTWVWHVIDEVLWERWPQLNYADVDMDFVVCWVPQQLVELADEGILVNPEGCIDWADSKTFSGHQFIRQLKSAKLL